MDKTTPVKEDSSELARELLIAISESQPDLILDPTPVHDNPYTPNGTELTKEAREDKLRSDLISISYSYSPSPEKIAVPVPATCPRPTES